jgi:hypothetical protein
MIWLQLLVLVLEGVAALLAIVHYAMAISERRAARKRKRQHGEMSE